MSAKGGKSGGKQQRLPVLLGKGNSAHTGHLQALLSKIGYQVVLAEDGEHAFSSLIGPNAPQLAVLDPHMSALSTLELCRKLRAEQRGNYTYIIVLIPWSEQVNRVALLEAGADDWLPSPVDVRELHLRLERGSQVVLAAALRSSEERFRSAFEFAGIGMAMVNRQGEFLQVNRALSSFLGFSMEELLGLKLTDVADPGLMQNSSTLLQELFTNGGGNSNNERCFITKSGEVVCASYTLSGVEDGHNHGEVDSFVLQVQDISARKKAEDALKDSLAASEYAVKELADQKYAMDQHAIVAITDIRGRITYANDKFCEISKYSREELIGQDHRLLNSRYHSKEFFQQMYKTIASGKVWRGEIRNHAKDGSVYWVDTTIVPSVSDDGKPWQYVAIRTDVTQRKLGEEALQRSEGFLRAITGNMNDLIFVLDEGNKWVYANPPHRDHLGYEVDELVGVEVLSLVHEDDHPFLADTIDELLRLGTPQIMKLRMRHKNGTWHHMEAHFALLRNTDGDSEGLLVVARNIDDRILAERKLQAAYGETELFFQAIPSLLIGMDSEGKVTRCNQTAAKVLGIPPESIKGKPIEDCGIHWLRPDMHEEIQRWQATEEHYRCDDLSFEREGKIRYLGLNVRKLPLQGNASNTMLLITGADITERRLLEDQLRQAQKLEAIGQLSAGVAHEINTPTQFVSDNVRFLKDSWQDLANLLGCGQELRQAADQKAIPAELLSQFDELSKKADLEYLLKEIPSAIDQSQEGLQRVAKIVRAIKEFSHPGSKEKEAVDLNKAIETTIIVARNEWKYVAEVETHFDGDLPAISCLSGEFNQVVLNLIVNASHAIADRIAREPNHKGKISVRTRMNAPWAEIEIGDTGQGIPPEIRSRVFEPFFTTKEVGKGTGQGLALAHSVIVNRHQGQIWFDSEMGVGTTFHIRLPLEVGVGVGAR